MTGYDAPSPAAPAAVGRSAARWTARLAPFAILIAMLGLLQWGHRDDSPTEDEWAHLTRGIAWWQASDTRLSYAHPPLGNAIAAIPVALMEGNAQVASSRHWKDANIGRVALDYIKKDYARAREQLFRARLMIMLMAAGLAAYVWSWTRSFWGERAALAALALVAFNPTIIAQGRYVTTDLPAGLTTMLVVGEFARYASGRGGRWSLVTMALAIGAAASAKYSGLFLVPILGVIGVFLAATGRGRFEGKPMARRFGELGLHALVAGAGLLLVINAVYKFDDTGMSVRDILAAPEPQYPVSYRHNHNLMEKYSALRFLPMDLRIPLPYTYLFGTAAVTALNAGGFTSYFLGEAIRIGHWAYFPVMLLIKNPPATVLLLLAGAALALRRVRSISIRSLSVEVIAVGAASALLLASFMRANLNMGIRHAMPIMPLLAVLAARAFDRLWALTASRRPAQLALAGLVASTALSALLAAPRFLGYFNLFVGGSLGGYKISIYGEDWGQDRAALAKYAKEHDIQPLYYNPMSETRRVEWEYFRVPYKRFGCETAPKPGSWVALHALTIKTAPPKCYKQLRGREPDVKVNNHIYLYRIPPSKPAR
ncbi:glycosyltransferase family 39 protein [Sorangium sp. So ce1024]|uniref:glycosyltransferase family 39 protein n=1 Tax=Sorangium sp. So ce1024 TaxID=3133327 RepID=UPI003F0A5565